MSKTNYIASMQGMPILADRAKKTENGTNIDSALGNKADNTPTFTEASTRANLNGSGETMPTILGKVKKWFTDLKALAFKATVGTSDIDNDAITAAKVKDNETLPVSISGNAASASSVAWANVSGTPSTYTPSAHAESTGSYGKGTTANYGHVKLLNGDLNGKSYTDGIAAASAHTHSQYLTSHQNISGKADKVSGSVNGLLAALDANGNLASSGISAQSVAATVNVIGGKQDSLPEPPEQAEDTYAINISGTANLLPYAYKKYVESSGSAILVSILKPGSSDPYSYKVFFDAYVSEGNMASNHASIEITVNRENGRSWKVMWDRPNDSVMSFSLKYNTSTNSTYLIVNEPQAGQSCGCVLYLRSATSWSAEPYSTLPSWLTLWKNPTTEDVSWMGNVTTTKDNSQVYKGNDLNTVGSTSTPVYVDTDGSIKECLLGIHSYNFGSASNYYKLADITFNNADFVYAGVQIAAQWRDNGNLTGSGIITISFAEYLNQPYQQGISGRVVVTFCRGDASAFSEPGFIFFVKKNTNTSYTLYAKVGTYKAISFGLMSGCCTGFSAPDTLTTISYSSSDTKLPYFVPSGTTYTPT